MDTPLKQRLIGAAVLVALAVIFLPMLIGGPEPETGEDTRPVSLDLPARTDRQFETRDLALPTPASTPPPAEPVLPQAAPEVAPQTTPDTPPPPERGAQGLATVDISAAPARTDTAAGQQRKPPPPAPATPPKSPAPPVAAASAHGQWAVHLGLYANAGNAQSLVRQLKAQGIPAYSEAVAMSNGKPAQRVRVGPFAQRVEAESARLSVRGVRADVPSSVIALEGAAARATAANTPQPAPGAGFAVQIGALRNRADAEALGARARKAGFAAYVESAHTDSGTLWRVRVGPEAQRAQAERLKTELKRKLDLDGNVVPHP